MKSSLVKPEVLIDASQDSVSDGDYPRSQGIVPLWRGRGRAHWRVVLVVMFPGQSCRFQEEYKDVMEDGCRLPNGWNLSKIKIEKVPSLQPHKFLISISLKMYITQAATTKNKYRMPNKIIFSISYFFL